MGVMTSGNWGLALWPGINSWYGKKYDEYPEEWKQLFDVYTSRKQSEEDVGVSSFGLASVLPEGSAVSYDTERQGFRTRYTHTEYALGFIITRILMEDDLYDVVGRQRAEGLAFSMRQTKETVCANVYNRATNSSYVGGDAVSLLNTAHPNVAGGTWSNKPSTDVDLSEAALEDACIAVSRFTNDRGLAISAMAKTLLIPPDSAFEAERILKSTQRVNTSNNDINALYTMNKFPGGVVVNHYFTDTDAWYIRTNVPHGMKFFNRRNDEFAMDNDFDTSNAKFKSTMRFSCGWTDPRGLYGSTGG